MTEPVPSSDTPADEPLPPAEPPAGQASDLGLVLAALALFFTFVAVRAFVLPSFVAHFSEQGITLPLATEWVLGSGPFSPTLVMLVGTMLCLVGYFQRDRRLRIVGFVVITAIVAVTITAIAGPLRAV